MAIRLYFDVHVKKAIADQFRNRGVDLIRAQEDGAENPKTWQIGQNFCRCGSFSVPKLIRHI